MAYFSGNVLLALDSFSGGPNKSLIKLDCCEVIFKGYCTSSRINCGMAKSLAQARACERLLAGDLAIPQLILELVQ